MHEIYEYKLPDGSYVRKEFVYVDGSTEHPAYVPGKGVLVASLNADLDLPAELLVPIGTMAAIATLKEQTFIDQRTDFANRAREHAAKIAENRGALAAWLVEKGAPSEVVALALGTKKE